MHTTDEVAAVVARLDALTTTGADFPVVQPVVLVLHGDEAQAFVRANYPANKLTVDRAARLEAYGLLDVRICERWMSDRGLGRDALPPFVDTVDDGVALEQELRGRGYLQF